MYHIVKYIINIPMTSSGRKLCYSIWNVNGLGCPIKRKKIMGHLKTKKQDLVFLRETHCCPQESAKLCRDWVGHLSYSAGSSKSRGVAILINKGLQYRLKREVRDEDGRIVEIQGHTLILANIYAPNGDHPHFFIDLESKLHDIGQHPIILGGDFNVVLDQILDKSKPTVECLILFCLLRECVHLWV